MKTNLSLIKKSILSVLMVVVLIGCQELDRPALGDYPKDANAPGGPLKFYVSFDGTSTNPLLWGVDQILANFPKENTLTTTAGITGNGVQGANKKFITYSKPNDWLTTAKGFTVSFWFKLNGQTKNNAGSNGTEYVFSIPSSNNHWSGGQAMLFFETNSVGTQIKFPVVSKDMNDTWFVWEGNNAIPGIADNTWRHCALVYDAATSKMTLYINGVANPNVASWGGHGDINMDNSTAKSFLIGCGPGTNYDSDDWLSSTWKGGLDQFRLYGTALTATEVNDLFTKKM
ncbi:MAG: LamG domain-containing protein [Crocinitomicaceae bacterium]|jgi:hypothetical protein|nr:LamG domain-containing protein [Crocinitomicaceae bacterium]